MLNFFKTKTFKVAVLAIAFVVMGALTVSAATYDFGTKTLKRGSTGENVVALQSFLDNGIAADGKFGPMTEAAVKAWQASNGLTPDGMFGPLSMSKANAMDTMTPPTVPLCPNGMTLASNCSLAPNAQAPVALCPNGMTLASNCTTGATTPVVTNGEGSVTVSYDAIPANALAVNKGESKAVMGIKVKAATGSDMTVSRLWLDVDQRIWLYADSITLLDGSTVIATMPLSASTVEEVTAGSAYSVKIGGFSFVVPAGTTKVLTVKISRPTLTTSSGNIAVAATSTLRAVDGAGISATYTLAARTLNLPSTTAATGTLTNTLSSSSPLAQSVSGLSATAGVTTAVKLMDFDLKATNGTVNTTAITGTLATTSGSTCTVAQCVASVELRDGSTVLASVTGATTLSFTALNIDVADGATKTLSLWGIMNHVASSYVVAGDGITAAVTATTGTSGATYASANTSNTVTGNTQYLFQYAPTFALVNTTSYPTSAASADETTSTVTNNGATLKVSFTVTAPAGSDIYLDTASTIQVQAYTATPTVPGTSKMDTTYGGTLTTSVAVSTTNTGSTSGYMKIAAGSSETITISGYVPAGGTAGWVGMRAAAIKWNTSDATSGTTVQTWGLSTLKSPTIRVTAN